MTLSIQTLEVNGALTHVLIYTDGQKGLVVSEVTHKEFCFNIMERCLNVKAVR